MNKPIKLIRELFLNIKNHGLAAIAAQTAYYILLSACPFLIFLTSLAARLRLDLYPIFEGLRSILPDEAYSALIPNAGVISAGFFTGLWAASRGINALIRGLNLEVCYTEKQTFRFFIKRAALSLLLTLSFIFILFISAAAIIFGDILTNLYINKNFQNFFRNILSILIIFCFFILAYKFIPDKIHPFRTTVLGSVFAVAGLLAISYGFAFYVKNFGNYSVIYGSFGGIIILLIWLYLASFIFLLGGEINAIFQKQL